MPGFGVKVTPRGRKVFLVMYRVAGAGSRLRKYTIGAYGRHPANGQGTGAKDLCGSHRWPRSGRGEEAVAPPLGRRSGRRPGGDLHSRTRREDRAAPDHSLLRRDVIPYWGAKSIHEIKKRDVSDLVSLIAQRNAHASHRLLKTLKTFFRWCVGRAVIDFSPAEGISSSYRDVSRDRVLTDQELAAVILAARSMPPPYGRIEEFLALTGQRREGPLSSHGRRSMRRRGHGPFPARERRTRGPISFIYQNRPGR